MGAVEILQEQSQIKWQSPGTRSGVIFSDLIPLQDATRLKERFHRQLEVELRPSIKDPSKARIFLDAQKAEEHLANNRVLLVPDFVPAIPEQVGSEPQLEVLAPMLPPLPNPTPRLNISETEWQAAEAYFKDPVNQKKGKMRKKDATDYDETLHKGVAADEAKGIAKKDATRHSFLFINGHIYAVANGEYRTGSGSFGNVKVIQDRKGDSDVVKVENYDNKIRRLTKNNEGDIEKEVGERVGMVKGEAVRPLMTLKQFKNYYTKNKLYTILEDRGKEELFDVINSNLKRLAKPNKGLPIAIQCCNAIQLLHDRRIIHRDVKPENFTTNKTGEIYLVNSIDFGLSAFLPEGTDMLTANKAVGTPGYAAPEVYRCEYLFVTDVYALGKFFPFLGVPGDIVDKMMEKDPHSRMTLGAATAKLIDLLRVEPDIDEQARQLIADFDKRKQETLNWIAENSGTTPVSWQEDHSGNKMLYKTPVMSLEDIYDVFQLMPDSSHYAEVVQVGMDLPEFQVVIDEQKLRQYMVKEQAIKQFNHIESELNAKLGTGLSIKVVDRNDTFAKGVHLNITSSLDDLAKLYAIRDALHDRQIPFKWVNEGNSLSPRFTIVMQDNVLNKIPDPKSFAQGIAISEQAQEEANNFKARYKSIQEIITTDEFSFIAKGQIKISLPQGQQKGIEIEFESDEVLGMDFSEALRDLGVNVATSPGRNPFEDIKIVIDESELMKLANDPELIRRAVKAIDNNAIASKAKNEAQSKVDEERNKLMNDRYNVYMFMQHLLDELHCETEFNEESPSQTYVMNGRLPSDISVFNYALKAIGIPNTVLEINGKDFTMRLDNELIQKIAPLLSQLPQRPDPSFMDHTVEMDAFLKQCQLGAFLSLLPQEFAKDVKQQKENVDPVKVGRWMLETSKQSLQPITQASSSMNELLTELSKALHTIEGRHLSTEEKATQAYVVLEELAASANEDEVQLKHFCSSKMEELVKVHHANQHISEDEKIKIVEELMVAIKPINEPSNESLKFR